MLDKTRFVGMLMIDAANSDRLVDNAQIALPKRLLEHSQHHSLVRFDSHRGLLYHSSECYSDEFHTRDDERQSQSP